MAGLSFSALFIRFDLWLHSEPHRAKDETEFRRGTDAEDAIGFVAPAREQLALITGRELNGASLG